jgi:hypothetical protein
MCSIIDCNPSGSIYHSSQVLSRASETRNLGSVPYTILTGELIVVSELLFFAAPCAIENHFMESSY